MSELREYSSPLTQYFLITWSHFILLYPTTCVKGGLGWPVRSFLGHTIYTGTLEKLICLRMPGQNRQSFSLFLYSYKNVPKQGEALNREAVLWHAFWELSGAHSQSTPLSCHRITKANLRIAAWCHCSFQVAGGILKARLTARLGETWTNVT